jgi:hypothetical protein
MVVTCLTLTRCKGCLALTYHHEVNSDLGRAEAIDALAIVDTAVVGLHQPDLENFVVGPEPEQDVTGSLTHWIDNWASDTPPCHSE